MRNLSKILHVGFKRTFPVRLKVGFMLFVGSFMTFMLRTNFSIIIIPMAESYKWSNYEQSLLLGAYFCGYVGPNLVAGILAERFGGRRIIFLIFLFSSVITALSPLTASADFQYLFYARLALGVCGGFFFSTCHNLISRWAPQSEKGKFVSSLLGAKLGTALTWPLMGLITEVFNWQTAFYVTAFISFVVAIVWLRVVADSPDKHSEISKAEREIIEESLELVATKRNLLPPLVEMFKSPPFWALLFLHFSDVWGIFFLLTSTPMFMSQVLKFDLKHSGLASSLPYLAQLFSGFLFGAAGDYFVKRGVDVTKIRKSFTIFSHVIPGLILFGFCFVEKNAFACIVLITLSLGFNGAAVMTSGQNPQDLAPNFAGHVFGITNFFATMSGFLSPLVVAYFTQEQSTMTEWRKVFILDGLIYISSAIFFMFFGSGEVQKWNKSNSNKGLMRV